MQLDVVVVNAPIQNPQSQFSAEDSMSAMASIWVSSVFIIIVTIYSVAIYLIVDNKYRIRKYRENSRISTKIDDNFYRIGRDEQINYYKFLREEIKREDEITHYRVTWSITFQGFIINAAAIALVFGWSDPPEGVIISRKLFILILAVMGLYMGFASLIGVLASRRSIEEAKTEWNKRNDFWHLYPNIVPQTFGQKNAFSMGTIFSIATPIGFITLWCLILAGYLALWITIPDFLSNTGLGPSGEVQFP